MATIWFAWGQAKSAPLGLVPLVLAAVSRASSVSSAAGREDTVTAVLKSKRVMDGNCILSCWAGMELPEKVRESPCTSTGHSLNDY